MGIITGFTKKGAQAATASNAGQAKQKWPVSLSLLSMLLASLALWSGIAYAVLAMPWFE
jgi:hypothetical protein